ncbi:MAG TPA: TonB-dependent receptor [Thermoanaerobaculia bacterium]|nr:TonB-dependent receptor [Thermoanaerobaculia bacterium]
MRHHSWKQHLLTLLTTLALAGTCALARAENAPAAATSDEPRPDAEQPSEPATAPPVTEEITVTATRFERPLDLTPKTVSVVTEAEVAARPMTNVQGTIDDVPNIAVARGGGLAGQLVVRGFASNDSRTVMFVDGDRFGRGRAALEYNFIDPNEIERIKIVRGPASALYGSDAMNGVVNFITRRGTGDSFVPRLASIGYASHNSLLAARVAMSGQRETYDALLGVNYRTAENYETARGEIRNTDFETRALNARFGWSPESTRRFELSGKLGRFSAGRAGAPNPPTVTVREDPLEEQSLRFGYTQSQAAPWISDLQASLFVREVNTFINSVNRGAANGNVETRDTWVIGPTGLGGKLLARSAVKSNLLTYGLDVYHEDVPSFEDEVRVVNAAGQRVSTDPRAKRIRDAEQSNLGLFAHYDWDASERFTAAVGARYDLVRTALSKTPAVGEIPGLSAAYRNNLKADDDKVTGSIGLIFRPLESLHLVANASTAFRTPTTFDKLGSGQIGAVLTIPNPDVGPETSVTYEGGARFRLRTFDANLTLFRTEYSDLLQTVFLNPTTRQRINIGEAQTEGFELDGIWTLSKALALRFNAAKTRGTNTLTDLPLPYVPPVAGLVALRWAVPGDPYWLEATTRWSRDKTRIDRSQERPLDGYEVYGLYGGVELGHWLPRLASYRLNVGVDNLTDEAYASPATRELLAFARSPTNPLLEPGRSFVVNVTSGF